MLTNGTEQHWFYGEDIERMKSIGWYEGSCNKRNRDYSGENNPMYGKSAIKGRKWVHKYIDGELKRLYIYEKNLPSYIEDGWELGMK